MNFMVLSPAFLRWLRYAALVATLLLCMATIFALGREVVRKLDALKVANSDSAQWTFAQIEVDYYRYKAALESILLHGTADIDNVRRQFDIFYSRVAILNDSPAYNELLKDPTYKRPLISVQDYMNSKTPIIDGNDEALFASISDLHDSTESIARDVRSVALRGLQLYLTESDVQRSSVASTLLRLAVLTAGLVAVLSLVAILYFRMYNFSSRNANALNETASRMSSVLSSSLDAIVVIDQDGVIIEYNGAASQVFGYSVDEAMGQKMDELIIPPRYYNAHRAGMKRFLETGQKRVVGAGRIELEALHKEGHTFPMEFSIDTAIQNGRTIFVSFMRDITEEKAAQKELVQARDRALAGEKAKAEFLAVMSHEMRTPLNGLLGTMSLLEETELNARQKLYLENMTASGRTLLRHVNDVLDISKFESGRVGLEVEQFHLKDLVDEVIESETPTTVQNSNNLRVEWHGDKLDHINGDLSKLRQVLKNLVSNANKFTENGDVTIKIKNNGLFSDRVSLDFQIVDTGIGIRHEDIDRIFNDFETLDSTYGRQNDGTGLGLGIVRRLVHLMDGEMGVESIPEKGSKFWFRLTFDVPAVASTSPWDTDAQTDVDHQHLDILMVEDNQINRFVLRGMLESEGHTIDEAENGRLGVALSERKRYDVILMDISMPVMDGVEATKHIRAGKGFSSKAPIVAVTAHALPEELEKFKQAGITDCLKKPLDKKKLHAIVAKMTKAGGPEQTTQNRGSKKMTDGIDIIDIERIDMMKDQLGEENLSSLLGRFAVEVDDVVGALKAAEHGTPEVSDLIPQIHKVAGSAAALGVSGIHKQLNLLEIAGKGEAPETMWDGVETLYVIWSQCQKVFSERFNIG